MACYVATADMTEIIYDKKGDFMVPRAETLPEQFEIVEIIVRDMSFPERPEERTLQAYLKPSYDDRGRLCPFWFVPFRKGKIGTADYKVYCSEHHAKDPLNIITFWKRI